MASEAKAVLDVALAGQAADAEDPTRWCCTRSPTSCSAAWMRPQGPRNPFVGNQHDAPLWRALAYARLGKWADAREGFRNADAAIGTLPIEMQRMARKIDPRLHRGRRHHRRGRQIHEFETVGIPREYEPALAVLGGRMAEGLGRARGRAQVLSRRRGSADRPAAAQGRLREIVLDNALGETCAPDAIADLETLTTIWRGDETEVEGLQLLARLYTEEGRYRDAFHIMRTALGAPELGDDAPHPGRGGATSTRCSSGARATGCRRSTRSLCSTISAS